jgi:hypothetical protein
MKKATSTRKVYTSTRKINTSTRKKKNLKKKNPTTQRKQTMLLRSQSNKFKASDRMLFFDDDLEHNIKPFRQRWPGVKAIHVPEGKNYAAILNEAADFHYPRLFAALYPLNQYAQALVAGLTVDKPHNLCDMCETTTGEALTLHDLALITEWANKPLPGKKVVLFDWDKTISICNGINTPDSAANKAFDEAAEYSQTMPFTFMEMAQYFAGTIERFHALRQMFAELRRNQVRCLIFTNNGWAFVPKTGGPKRFERINFFTQIAQALDPGMTAFDIIYGHLDKQAEFGKNKVLQALYVGR